MENHFDVLVVKEAPGGLVTEHIWDTDFAAALDTLHDQQKIGAVVGIQITDPEGSTVEQWIRTGDGEFVDAGAFDAFLDRQFEQERI